MSLLKIFICAMKQNRCLTCSDIDCTMNAGIGSDEEYRNAVKKIEKELVVR